MRLGLVIYNTLETVSGGYLYDRQLVQALRRAGDTVEIISLPWSTYNRHLLHNLRPSLKQRLQYGWYDLLLQDELNHPSLFLVNEQLQLVTDRPIVSVVHHLRSSEQHPATQLARYRRIERRYLRSVDGFIYNSETTRATAERLLGGKRPYVVARPAADHVQATISEEEIRVRARRVGPLRLLFVGNVIPRKGLHTLLAALARLPGDTWRLSIAGDIAADPPYAHQLQRYARQEGLARNVTWHGRLLDSELWQQYAGSDLLVVPSSYEGFGIVYLEGMAFGLPAIATWQGAARELISNGENGFLVSAADVDELAQLLVHLYVERDLLEQMSLGALERFKTFPDWTDTMASVRRFLLGMLELAS